jgi:cytochrome c
MKKVNYLLVLVGAFLISCGGSSDSTSDEATAPPQSMVADEADPMDNKGVGPITSVTLSPEIDTELAAEGEKLYQAMCTACHKIGAKYIGPAANGVLDRRSPEWVMNMILNPDEMVKKDPVAKQLLIEYNGAPMANQNLTEDQARAVLEYFRTLD